MTSSEVLRIDRPIDQNTHANVCDIECRGAELCSFGVELFHATQNQIRFAEKTLSQQYTDAVFADLDARGLEYDPDPREEVVAYISDYILAVNYDLDAPWNFTVDVQPQFDLFDQLDAQIPVFNRYLGSERISSDGEPVDFQFPLHAAEDLAGIIGPFQDRKRLADSAGRMYEPVELAEYYNSRILHITKHANDRIKRIRGGHDE